MLKVNKFISIFILSFFISCTQKNTLVKKKEIDYSILKYNNNLYNNLSLNNDKYKNIKWENDSNLNNINYNNNIYRNINFNKKHYINFNNTKENYYSNLKFNDRYKNLQYNNIYKNINYNNNIYKNIKFVLNNKKQINWNNDRFKNINWEQRLVYNNSFLKHEEEKSIENQKKNALNKIIVGLIHYKQIIFESIYSFITSIYDENYNKNKKQEINNKERKNKEFYKNLFN